MRILYLAHRIPYPPNKGDKIRSFNQIKYLSIYHEIHLACLADNKVDLQYKDKLKKYCKSVNIVLINPVLAKLSSLFYLLSRKPSSVPYFYSNKLQKIVNYLISTINFDCILCFSSPMAEYIFRVKGHNQLFDISNSSAINHKQVMQPTRLIMDFVDVDSDKWLQYSKYARFPLFWLYHLESIRLAKYERKVAETFDLSIFVSENEVKLFKKQNPQIRNVTAISNGVDIDYFNPDLNHSSQFRVRNDKDHYQQSTCIQKPVLLFTGTMDYYANIDGVTWFCKDIFQRIKKRFPTAQFYIVGNKPDKKIQRLMKNDGVVVTGFIEDIRQCYRMADLYVAPLRIARGIQNKILEAMAMGVPVVGTSNAFQGINASIADGISIADNPDEFARDVIKLLVDHEFKRHCSIKARRYVLRFHQWKEHNKSLETLLQGAMKEFESFNKHNALS